MRRALLLPIAALCASGCFPIIPGEQPDELSTFRVETQAVRRGLGSAPVVQSCNDVYAPALPPDEVRGTPECPYALVNTTAEIDVTFAAVDRAGEVITGFTGPISFRVVPGRLAPYYRTRWAMIENGVGAATLEVGALHSEVRVWVEDAPPQLLFGDNGQLLTEDVNLDTPPEEPAQRSFAAGVSPIVYFEQPTLAKLQVTDFVDNKLSPFTGSFMEVGRNPDSGPIQIQSCDDDEANNGEPVMMVITGVDNSGFFVTDITACRQPEESPYRIGEPDGYFPGTFGSMYVYNYSHPEGLDVGDLIWTLSGSVTEFTSTTQMTFPAWTMREKVLPTERDKYLQHVIPHEINMRRCGIDNGPFVTDALCGQNRRNFKLEGMESSLVKLPNVRVTEVFKTCDLDGDGMLPCFSERPPSGFGVWQWGPCSDDPEPDIIKEERACYINCVAGLGEEFGGRVCSERTNFAGFGQFNVELPSAGPAELGLDPSLPGRTFAVTATETSARTPSYFPITTRVRLQCAVDVHYQFGGSGAFATLSEPVLAAGTVLEHVVTGNHYVHVLLANPADVSGTCHIADNPQTKILTIFKDALPEVNMDCSTSDPDPDAAQQCVNLRAARFDIVGHLRQVQPARPRWMVIPRDRDDICCRPGPGLACPVPIEQCE